MPILDQCAWCGRGCYPNELTYSELHGGLNCRRCLADQGPTHGEIQAKKRESAKSAAWNNGDGWGE